MNKDRFEQDFKTIFGNGLKNAKAYTDPNFLPATGSTFPGSRYPYETQEEREDERSERDKAGATPVRGRGDK